MDITDRINDALGEVAHLGISLTEQRQRVAEHLANALFPRIETVEQLKALPASEDKLAGTLLKAFGYSDLCGFAVGSVFEQNDDGTWLSYDSAALDVIKPEDMPLPAFVLWRS